MMWQARRTIGQGPAALVLAFLYCSPLAAVGQIKAEAAGRRDLEIGPETTVYEEPLRPDGTVDYVAAIDRELSEGVTNNDNAFVALLRVLPLKDWDPEHRRAVFEKLDLPQSTGNEPKRFVPLEALVEVDSQDGSMFNPYRDGGLNPYPTDMEISIPEHERWRDQAMEGPWTEDELPEIKAWIDANSEALAIVEEAVRRPKYWSPFVATGEPGLLIEVLQPHLGSYRTVANALQIRAFHRLAVDDLEGAWRDVLTLKRLARLAAREPTTIAALTGASMSRLSADIIRHISNHPHLTAERASAMLEDLQTLEPIPHPRHHLRVETLIPLDYFQTTFIIVDDSERIEELPPDVRQAAAFARADEESHVDINRGLRQLNKLRQEQLEIVEIESAPEMAEAWDRFRTTLEVEQEQRRGHLDKASLKTLPRSQRVEIASNHVTDAIADSLVAIGVPTYKIALLNDEATRMTEDLETVALALMAYRAKHGNYPAELDALAPEYLNELPVDRFAEAPLHYQLTDDAAMVYSIGDDFEDDGGAEDFREGDLVMRLER